VGSPSVGPGEGCFTIGAEGVGRSSAIRAAGNEMLVRNSATANQRRFIFTV